MKRIIHNRKYRLTTLLTGLVTASVLLTTVILLIASFQSERESLTNTYLSLNYSKADKISRSVDSLFHAMRNSLEKTAAYLSEHENLTDHEIQEQLELIRESGRYFNSLSWVDETGLVRNIAPSSVGLKGEYITGITKDVVDSKEATLTTPYVAPSGRLIVLLSQPIYDKEGKYRGMLGGTIYMHQRNVLNEILGNDIIDENGSYYYVVGPDGKLLFHPDTERIGQDVTANKVVRKLTQGKSGMEKVINTKDVSMLAAYSFIPDSQWGVVQQTPISYINELLINNIKKLFLYILSPFLILLLVSITLAQKLAKPFINLANVVNRLGDGHKVTLPENETHWNREADLLTKSVRIAVQTVQESHHQLEQEAITDALTGIHNRRKFQEVLESWTIAGQKFSLVVFDIDHFKAVNDTFGHQAGDEVLRFLADTVQARLKKKERFFRYGGEEFVLLVPNSSAADSFKLAEEIRTAIEGSSNPVGRPVTVSLGIADFPGDALTSQQLFDYADKALYQAKIEGRNKTVIWKSE
ncbi:sensor domain-containing diguanylate cyclase [Bacillus sp. AK031]